MAEVAVSFLVENLMQLLKDNIELTTGVEGEVDKLLQDFDKLNAYLKEAAKSPSENEVQRELVKSIRKVVNLAEDAIDKFVIEAKLHKAKGVTRMLDVKHFIRVKQVAVKIKDIRERVKEIRVDSAHGLQTLQLAGPVNRIEEERKAPVVEENDVVGFDEEAQKVIDRLLQGSQDLEVVPIVGMPGLGKTTLANKIFKHPTIEYEFITRVWVYVSQSFKTRELYLNIIGKFTGKTEQYQCMSENDLAEVVRGKLGIGGKYLIVLDDVWTREAWDSIKNAFPNNKRCNRVLLTSRHRNVADSCNIIPHDLKFLTAEESWYLLELKTFLKVKCPSELEKPGKSIARKCKGLPLAIVVIAGALIGKGQTTVAWEEVDQTVGEHLINIEQPTNCKKLVEMSYHHLPYDMKACFLYFGAFPRGYVIPAWKLIRLWISECFVHYKGALSLESKARDYLNDLVNRNLVMVVLRKTDGQIKTCRVHDVLHEFCWQEATREENLFHEVKLSGEPSFQEIQERSTYRRLCVHSSVLDFISRKPSGEHVRSFLCFSSGKQDMPKGDIPNIPKAFPLIRVLDVESIVFSRFCREFFQLYHLRYIAFSSDKINSLPKQIGELWNVQTLIVNTQQSNLDIQADIWNMPRLRHVHTNASAKLPTPAAPTSNKAHLVNQCLQTLSTIAPESCTEEVFSRTPTLKKLGIRGNMAMLLEPDNSKLFNNVKKLQYLENMKLINVVQTGKQLRLPPAHIFPTKLRKMTLSKTCFKWEDMSVLGQLLNLVVLKLKDDAFTGEYWETKVGGFPSLLVLWVERTDLATWNTSADHFPSLKRLVVISCDNLEEIPVGLADIPSLQVMELTNSTKRAAQSARVIQAKKDKQPEEGAKTTRFKLSISPPDL